MITGFQAQTEPLTDYERNTLLPVICRGLANKIAEARAIVSWLARRYTSMTLTSIGKRLGRDHISVIHYVRMVGSWMEEPRLNIRGARITQKLIDEIEQ